ncbi:MAG: glycosyltransferase family 4 protein [Candidatus Magasanikbacteria bacterium]|nr:glycosyltransferase family 4 protein [Candidatus Magasanikbacteria bacterium]
MRIGIDARMMGPRHTGLGRYVEQLVVHLLKQNRDWQDQYVLFLRRENWDYLAKEHGLSPDKYERILADIPWYTFAEQVHFLRILLAARVDLLHFPHWNVPLLYSRPFVVTIHDLTMFHYPRPAATTLGPFLYFVKDRAHRLLLQRVVKRAKVILITSEYTKNDIHESLAVPSRKMDVTYQAPLPVGRRLENTSIETVLNKYRLNHPYVLYVGTAYPHKNVSGLLDAWRSFEHKYGSEYQLVLAGRNDAFYRLLDSKIQDQPSVCFTGFVTDQELSALYQRAAVYVIPSLYEGFGLPPLEAMQYGVPVVASNRSCLPEVLGEAAMYVDPENPEQLSDALHAVLTDENLRATCRAKARLELQRYSWERLARETRAVYIKALGS